MTERPGVEQIAELLNRFSLPSWHERNPLLAAQLYDAGLRMADSPEPGRWVALRELEEAVTAVNESEARWTSALNASNSVVIPNPDPDIDTPYSRLTAAVHAARAALRAATTAFDWRKGVHATPAPPEPGLDVERLTRALDNLYESRWGRMSKGQTTVNLEHADAIADEYDRLLQTNGGTE